VALPEREFHYAAYDVIHEFVDCTDEYFLDTYVTALLLTTPWWDTVDGLVNAAVSPLCRKYDAECLIDEWSESGDRWLIRAAIGHQRGWKAQTHIGRVIGLCDRHWGDSEFFVAKAIGWALRDLARLDATAVERFLDAHPDTNRVAIREAQRGLAALRRPSKNDD
jgi:3-methyladenine DNA glycosylase AlkD